MLFGKSVFQSVLDRLETENQDDNQEDAAAFRMAGLKTGFVVEGGGNGNPNAFHQEAAYRDFAADPAPDANTPPAPKPMPDHLVRLQLEEIAEDLNISIDDTVQSLAEKRRAFARANHPDGVDEEFRANATRRMTIANQLIDEAIRRLERPSR